MPVNIEDQLPGVKYSGFNVNGVNISAGAGVPTATQPKGSLYLRTDGSSASTRAYINSDGAATWVAMTTAS